ncbi:MAG: UDP-glucose/GDP-mannose dehydrogenase family protein [Acidobacteria bacterium]|nr:UDP-glucose/GDP-mannose dehydrogenase family protein [Acidobacteriota bacterium]
MTTKISYANMLAELCERLPGADVDVVTGAIGIDRRIGHRYLRGAVGYGGPCFPRDNAALAAAAALVGAHADLAVATDVINRRQVDRVAEIVRRRVTPRQHRVGVLGLSYKPDTPVVDESQGVILANRLAADGFSTTVFDPAALQGATHALAPSIARADSIAGCLDASDLVIVMVPWPEFREIPAFLRAMPRRPLIILDCWRLFEPLLLHGLADLVHLGKASALPEASGPRAQPEASLGPAAYPMAIRSNCSWCICASGRTAISRPSDCFRSLNTARSSSFSARAMSGLTRRTRLWPFRSALIFFTSDRIS